MNTSNKNVYVITNVDSHLGFALAYRFVQAKKNKEDGFISNQKIRVLYRERSGFGLDLLEKMGAESAQVNYEDQEQLKKGVQGACVVTLIPEHSEKRMKEAENLLKICSDQKVEYVCLHSMIGADMAKDQKELKNLQELYKIEEMVKEHFKENHGIVRNTLFSQIFYFMASQIEGNGEVALPVKEDVKWGTVDMNDSINAVYNMVRMQHENREKGEKMHRIVQLTPSKTRTTKEMMNEISKGLGRNTVHFKKISEDDMRKYLESVRDKDQFKERPESSDEGSHMDRDGPWSFPLGKFLNNKAIECLMEFWRLANMGKADVRTDDLEKILKREPKNLEEYFKKNRDQFRRFK